ncbi:prephenate dehydrogenase/arogenate dehydrogenase family protein [Luteolibacter sp. GHJ8]|uniref:Prephenate dehydrogenase/arogenate dehydrogenase family protein n=1 Tax=Luteolibacter rhizosphaerae TaxID=2989719 RepID=A0ABT3G858_9BACT|nr:prephenate dehydrogenase/arogenate dehydrogenase family protein [Luteolibacter rhizosphaerae]MCW1916030.1 prephenate dehydrogenase/arogenate dehydrogenase family protein [Luteolibacter rhizosphaerae]
MDFNKVAILGGGLLGGSLALALRERFPHLPVALWARRAATVESARQRGISGATEHLAAALDGADLVVLSTPVGAMATVLLAAQSAGLWQDALVTDVGSVKAAPHRCLQPILRRTGGRFIGSHPMAGSEQTGISAAEATLFDGAACLLTDDDRVGDPWSSRLQRFWEAVGCRVSWMEAQAHDALVARISHFPHLMAAAAAKVALTTPSDGRFGGGGLRDTTRVAGGDPDMWAEIVTENREALRGVLSHAITEMSEMLAMLEAGEQEALRRWLDDAKQAREAALAVVRNDFP